MGIALGGTAAATAMAAGMHRVNLIRSMEFMGQAHGGLDYVPKTGTYLLEQGERVVRKQDASNSSGAVFNQVVHVDASNSSGVNIEQVRQAARDGAQEGYNMVASDFNRNGPIRRMIR